MSIKLLDAPLPVHSILQPWDSLGAGVLIGSGNQIGSRPIPQKLQALIRQLAAENKLWGQRRIQAELAKLGLGFLPGLSPST
jgi:hypothetical protein